MRKNAFTLVELLAVIVILAIIALIAVPIVINIITDTKEASTKRSLQLYTDTVIKNISSMQTKDPNYDPDECRIQENGNVICLQNDEVLKVTETSDELEVPMKGIKPTSGTIKLQDGKVVDIVDLYLDDKYANYDENGDYIFYLRAFPTEAGLYDGDRNLIASWDDLISYGFNDYAFNTLLYNHQELKKGEILIISNSVTNIMGFMFDNCKNLTNVIIPNSVTSIGEYAFRNCTGLKSITIPDSVTTIDNSAFRNCSGLTSITIPASVTSIGSYAFNRCTNLSSIKFKQNSQLTIIDSYAFESCSNLTSIIIPDSVTSIEYRAFYMCNKLTNVIIGNGITTINYNAFANCSSLTNVTIGNSVTTIERGAFSGCNSLSSLIFKNTEGWFVADDTSATTGDSIDVTNASTNATNLKTTYANKFWKRN